MYSTQIHSPLLGDKVDYGTVYQPASLCSLTGRYDNHMLGNFIPPVRDYELGLSSVALKGPLFSKQ